MLLILGNTPISKHHCLCLNPCLDIPTKLKFNVKNLVTKHDLDLNCKSPLYRKIGPLEVKTEPNLYIPGTKCPSVPSLSQLITSVVITIWICMYWYKGSICIASRL